MGNELTDGERMVRMETEMISIKGTVLELKTMLTELSKRDEKYVTKDVLEEKLKLRDMEIQGLQSGLNETRNQIQNDKQLQHNEQQTKKQIVPTWVLVFLTLTSTVVALILGILALLHK